MYCSFQQNEGIIVLGATNRRDNLDKYVIVLTVYVDFCKMLCVISYYSPIKFEINISTGKNLKFYNCL